MHHFNAQLLQAFSNPGEVGLSFILLATPVRENQPLLPYDVQRFKLSLIAIIHDLTAVFVHGSILYWVIRAKDVSISVVHMMLHSVHHYFPWTMVDERNNIIGPITCTQAPIPTFLLLLGQFGLL
jgi:hypothetical protein